MYIPIKINTKPQVNKPSKSLANLPFSENHFFMIVAFHKCALANEATKASKAHRGLQTSLKVSMER